SLRCSWSHIGDGASVRAATRVNAEQDSKRSMCRPTRLQLRGRLIRLGEMSEDDAQPLHRGTGGSTYTRKAYDRATSSRPAGNAKRAKASCGRTKVLCETEIRATETRARIPSQETKRARNCRRRPIQARLTSYAVE